MARARDPRRDQAYDIYKAHNGEIKLKDIAEQLGVSEGTVRGWKNKDSWDDRLEAESNGTFQSKQPKNTERSVKKKTKKTQRSKSTPEAESQATVQFEIVPSDGLNDKQLLFCMFYVKYFNATKAYQKAYQCDYITANRNAHRLMVNEGIKEEIMRLKQQLADSVMLDARDVLQKYIDIAFADITDYSDFGTVEEILKDETGKPLLDYQGEEMTYQRTYVHLKSADEVDGTIISEVKKGKDGVSVKLVDKMAALAMLSKYTDLLSDEQLKRLREEKLKVDIAKVRSETKGARGSNTTGVDLSNLTTEELRAIANSKR
ncbi:terminase small subunit [Lysinibacillus boronitolerans]|uniref:terminase small subunit n=1 Tax=Lysinibacillus boronitolerans TaxID=309788 RepID=UPI0028973889|nr:terminase small subunit [Lysinibacillus boronitolerans]